MGKIGYGYGSEWHLLRHLGYHREDLSRKTLNVTGGNSIEWLDFGFSEENAPLRDDKEFLGLEFIEDERVQERWKLFWAQTGNAQNWDAVGKIHYGDRDEWLLVEAKAHVGELKSKCGATDPESKKTIYLALEKTRQAFGNQSVPVENWLAPYYQYANRLAVLHFLMKGCAPPVNARLLFIYFCGENRKNLVCPKDEQGWLPSIQEMKDRLGYDKSCELAERVHELFLPVNPAALEYVPAQQNIVRQTSLTTS
ncbi:MAG: hypothetical protein NT028_06710 [candidate division Zixibacteria bacterium]|nr:hypothetical protein [candidate division Zixibacteria bacterium]